MRVNRSTVANQSHGFTLIELITVVAIISILASLILAAFTRAKSRVRSTECQHNLRQQGVILTSFVRDHSEYPLYATEKRVAGNNSTWASTLFPGSVKDLTNNRGIFECPSARRPDALERDGGWVAYGYNQNGLTGSSFDEPLGIGGKGGAHWLDRNPVAESDVLFPARMIAIGDGMAGWQGFISDGLVACGRKPLERPSTWSHRPP